MARTRSRLSAGTLILDSEGLSKWCAADQRVTAYVREAQDNDFRVAISALTPVEGYNMRAKNDRFRWYLSRLRIEPVTDEIAFHAIDLLRAAGLHGHKYAIDAVVAATALRASKPAVILTSDADDMAMLCGKQVRVVAV
ncbi:PIN domain-containing protein [Nocardia goodfellowii]|uniref:Nucleic acid-binding protein n=1 Tax=Nocardia goodfellowii TaxID=882446 RepID=A0ABS4QIS2_9NOCA|nr:PIN domain-containing protein [Nocardia goodfellowii]MBP2190556.1 putative nucleic acid-binding protein [Nocardia goodfellowii]